MPPCGLVMLALLCASGSGCVRRVPGSAPTAAHWLVGRTRPDFDPDGPADAVRASLERLLTRSLVSEDSSGAIVPEAAESFGASPDQLTWTFQLRERLRFTDGTRCTSRDFRDALVAGLGRTDHSTRPWLLASVRGVEAVRPGRPLPPLGIETPDARTLVLHLVRPDSLLPRKLALPGVSAAWRSRVRAAGWDVTRGLGPYRVAQADVGRLRLVRVAAADGGAPDTLHVRFVPSAARVRSLLRAGRADLVWPPPLALDQGLTGYRVLARPARPARWLWLVLRADVPPTTKLEARHAFGHAIHRGELNQAVGPWARPGDPWLEGAPAFEFPRLDAVEVSGFLARGKLGRSFHVTLAYDADGPGAAAARALQGAASRVNIYVELRPLRGSRFTDAALVGTTQLLLVEAQAPLDRPEAQLAQLVMPLRGPAVGSFRTGWRTREFDPWLLQRRGAMSLGTLRVVERLGEELVALPVASLPWTWIERPGRGMVRFHPRFGPEFSVGHGPAGRSLSH